MSAERIDHARAARIWVEGGERPDVTTEQATALATLAQVHATLALVEQQRIANLMDYLRLIDEKPGPVDDLLIREALGLS